MCERRSEQGEKIGGAGSLFLDPKAKSHDPIGKLHPTSIHDARSQDGVRYFTLQNVHVVHRMPVQSTAFVHGLKCLLDLIG